MFRKRGKIKTKEMNSSRKAASCLLSPISTVTTKSPPSKAGPPLLLFKLLTSYNHPTVSVLWDEGSTQCSPSSYFCPVQKTTEVFSILTAKVSVASQQFSCLQSFPGHKLVPYIFTDSSSFSFHFKYLRFTFPCCLHLSCFLAAKSLFALPILSSSYCTEGSICSSILVPLIPHRAVI